MKRPTTDELLAADGVALPDLVRLEGSALWVFPNPSPINTRYPLAFLVERFVELRESLGT
jgi:hypothetical protein